MWEAFPTVTQTNKLAEKTPTIFPWGIEFNLECKICKEIMLLLHDI